MKETPETPALLESPLPALPADHQPAASTPIETTNLALSPKSAPDPEPVPQADVPKLLPEPVQEIDAWWGSYSGWTMIPSMGACVGLTVLITWGSWRLLDKGWVQFSILTLTAALWLLQAIRWCYRVFGYNYRLTTQRLFQSKGLLYKDAVEMNLAAITKVEVQHSPHGMLTGIGNVCLILEGPTPAKVVLEGVARPQQVAGHIRRLSEKAREGQVLAAKV